MSNLLSIILLSYNSEKYLSTARNKICSVFEAEKIPFELIIMDDGSQDNSPEIAKKLEQLDERVKAYQLSRNYTSHYSAFAGLSVCSGNCAVLIPDDEQLPYIDIVKMYRLWEAGHQVIIPYRAMREENRFKVNTSHLFYILMNKLSDIKFPPGGADTFLIDRELIDILNYKIHPIHTTTLTEILRLGFDPYYYPYTRPLGKNKKSRWSFKKKLFLAKDFFFSSSTFPIKLITFIGMFFSFFSLALIFYYTYLKIFGNQKYWKLDLVPGWVSTIVVISFFSGLILFSIGVLAEYIWRIFEEVKGRPGYIIRRK